jgi:hypothetical protein
MQQKENIHKAPTEYSIDHTATTTTTMASFV